MDDDPLLRWSLVRFLEARGLEARSVESGKLALALLQEWPVDILITATRLSGMEGLELISRCQGFPCRPAIILLSEGEAPPSPRDLGRLGVLGVIEKPLILDSLARLLAGILKKTGSAAA
ncbi:MAG: response regulator [candidate division NC10 bacterium]